MHLSFTAPSNLYPSLALTTSTSKTKGVPNLAQRVQSTAQNVHFSHQPQIAQPKPPTLPFSQGQNSGHNYCMHAQDHSPFGTTTEGGRQYFTPPSEPGTPVGIARRSRSVSGESNFWVPTDTSEASSKAAFSGAMLIAQNRAQQFSAANRPGMLSVAQDPSGNAVGGLSVKRRDQDRWQSARNPHQTAVLDLVSPSSRGKGHGNCAEQVVTHKATHLEEQNRFQVAQSSITAIGTGRREGILTPACGSCQFTNQFFGLHDTVGQAPQTGSGFFSPSSLRPRSASSSSLGWETPRSSSSSTSSFSSIASRNSLFRK
ncbi:MAG: hypothetical protein EBS28_00830 [Chlamydiae bacterium]|nr:hypothetical protein [Chlamydiota bacterium]